MNPEGDVAVNDELINGLGTWLLHAFFGSLIAIANSHSTSTTLPPLERESETSALMPPAPQRPATVQQPLLPPEVGLMEASTAAPEIAENFWHAHVEPVLTACVPNPGYFAAGGVAGIVSRTTTAPLDRLKVYLIAQTSTAKPAVHAAKSGAPVSAAKQGIMSLVNATKELWAAGGMRSLYAGMLRRITCGVAGADWGVGNGLNVVKVMPESAVKFGAFEVRVTRELGRTVLTKHRHQNACSPRSRVTEIRETSTPGRNSWPVASEEWFLSKHGPPFPRPEGDDTSDHD